MHCTKVQKINENKLFISSFLGKKVFLQQNNPNNNRKTTDKWAITLGLAQASVSLEV